MRVWELWFADFPYEEDNTIVKSRPVIILNVEPLEVLSVKVTSQQSRNSDKYDMPIVHWQYAGLKKPSVARISKTMFLDKNNFTKK
ncbi:MAG: type II toxin-antitoxin system PemK/MazF family toxin [Clostridia bacterium]|nr:type II toxin-antitoxin system PemK/MazF family toxin [Clostridia bacterium]